MHRRAHLAVSALLVFIIVVAAAACGTSDSPELSSQAERGRQVSIQVGCANCHGGLDAAASVGPSWSGSWGTIVELNDGATVRFDAPYVERSVRSPGEQRRAGDWVQMPAYGVDQLTDDEIAALAAYIEEMG